MDIFDVAKGCGVSKSTVSRVLNNHPYVSENTRKKILEYIKKNNYTPNNIATYFRNKTTKSIAISIPYIDHPFFSRLSSEISRNFSTYGYKALIHQTFCSPIMEEEILLSLKRNEIDAVILCSVENEYTVIEEYLHYGIIISSNDAYLNENISNFHFDETEIGYKATNYLIKKNIKHIGICLDNSFNSGQQMRLYGYKKALKEHGITHNEKLLFTSAFSIIDGIKIANKIKGNNIEIEGLFTGNDHVSAGIQKILKNEIITIGTDNHDICQITNPKLNSISLPISVMAQDICLHVIKCLNENSVIIVNKTYSTTIVENKECAS